MKLIIIWNSKTINFFISKIALFFICFNAFCFQGGEYKTLEGKAQGSTYRIVYQSDRELNFSHSVDSLFGVIDHSMSLWLNNSLISKVNANQPYDKIDEHFTKVFKASEGISRKTDAYFDVSVGPLVKAWGFGKSNSRIVPNNAQLDSLKKLVSYKNIKIKKGKVIKKYPDIQLDFNAIAQGYSVDLICDFLIKNGVANFLVEVGGEVRAKGKNSKQGTWKVGIENPNNENSLQAVVLLDNKSLATSGSYRKYFVSEGQKYSHAIDPHLGKPVTHNVLSMTVLANTCAEADAYATAFLVMGLEKAKIYAKKEKVDFFAIYANGGELNTYATSGMKKAIEENK